LVSTLSYPVIVLITAFFAVGFMLKFLVPMFQDVFLQLGNELPAITKFVIYLSDGFGSFILFVSAFWLALFLLYQWKKESDRFKEFSSNLLLKIPIIGELVRKTILIQFCQTLQLLLQARIPLSTALSLLERMIPFYPIKKSLVIVQKSLLEGKQFHESLALFSIYDTKLITLVKVAEESNQLHMIFEKLNIQYQHELKHKTKLLSTIIEPAIIILLGGVIAFILVAMYLPMFSISSSFM
jgi:type IV pilus assembly protein PilC